MNFKMLLGLALLGMGCATVPGQPPESKPDPFVAKVLHQASIDLACPEEQLFVRPEVAYVMTTSGCFEDPSGRYEASGCCLNATYDVGENGIPVMHGRRWVEYPGPASWLPQAVGEALEELHLRYERGRSFGDEVNVRITSAQEELRWGLEIQRLATYRSDCEKNASAQPVRVVNVRSGLPGFKVFSCQGPYLLTLTYEGPSEPTLSPHGVDLLELAKLIERRLVFGICGPGPAFDLAPHLK